MRLWSLRNILLEYNFWENIFRWKPFANILLNNFFRFLNVLIFWLFLIFCSLLTWTLSIFVFLTYFIAASFLWCSHLTFFSQIYWKTFCSWDVLMLINMCRRRDISWFIRNFRQWFCPWSRFWSIWFLSSNWFIPKVRFRYIT